MRNGGNSFYYIVFGALLVIMAFALMTTIPSWREIMLGPAAPRRELAPSTRLASAGVTEQEKTAAEARAREAAEAAAREAAEKAAAPPPMAAPGLPRESKPPRESGRPAGIFKKEATYKYGGEKDIRPVFTAPKPSYNGPYTLTDVIVYDSPNGNPLPAPSLTRTALILIRGTRIGISERRGEWLKVLTPAGQRGWVVARDIANLPQRFAKAG